MFDAKGSMMAKHNIYGGSVVKVNGSAAFYDSPSIGAGVTLRLRAVQVIEYVEGSSGAGKFGFGEEVGFTADESVMVEDEAVVGNGNLGTVPPTHTSGTVANGQVQLTFLKAKVPEELFEIERDGSINFAGQEGFFTPNGARKWEFVGAGEALVDLEVTVNSFIAPGSDTLSLIHN